MLREQIEEEKGKVTGERLLSADEASAEEFKSAQKVGWNGIFNLALALINISSLDLTCAVFGTISNFIPMLLFFDLYPISRSMFTIST
jgi:hypothetical protein